MVDNGYLKKFDMGMTCCPWGHGLLLQKKKKLYASVAVPLAPVRVPSQRSIAQSVSCQLMTRVIMN